MTVLLGREKLFSLDLHRSTCTIGRSGRCDVVLPLPEVSRIHAALIPDDDGFLIEDRSRNGLTHDGVRVGRTRVSPGDEFRLAAYTLRFEGPVRSSGNESTSTTTETLVANAQAPTTPKGLGELLGESGPMREVFALVRRLSLSDIPVLLLGETGTGKELVARALHSLGHRRNGPWVAVNCAAISPELVESELFGHEKGAFTGAHRRRDGAFVAAGGGTLFLDEIGEMPLALQPKLLRVLESSEIVPVGGSRSRPVSSRVIAATNRDLLRDAEAGRFRKDLYYRLCVVPVALPPLRERGEDIVLLAQHLASEEDGGAIHFTSEGLDFLRLYPWPGNVRELRNLVRRIVSEGAGGPLGAEELRRALDSDRKLFTTSADAPPHPRTVSPFLGSEDRLAPSLREIERVAIMRALQDCRGNRAATARRLGIAQATLYDKIKRYGLRDVR